MPVHKFNDAKPDEIGKNPKLVMGSREEITGKLFYNFAKKISDQGATILGGCCETTPLHIKEISKLK